MIKFTTHSIFKLGYSFLKYVINIRTYRRNGVCRNFGSVSSEVTNPDSTLFILGSGNSIKDITPDQWAEVAQNDSIGLNLWLHHEHVPNLYVVELISDAKDFLSLLTSKEEEYLDTTFIVKSTSSHPSHRKVIKKNLQGIPESLIPNFYTIKDFEIPGRSAYEVKYSIGILKRLGMFKPKSEVSISAHLRGSLVSLMIMAIQLGYKDIVLCGIDLEGKSFFEASDTSVPNIGKNSHVRHRKLKSALLNLKDTNTHLTENAEIGMPISEVLEILVNEVCIEYGVRVSLGTPSSRLSSFITSFSWEKQ